MLRAAVSQRPRLLLLQTGAVLLGVGLTGFLVVDASRAAFTASTDNPANSLSAGTVVLTDDDADNRMFNVSGLNGGQVLTRCINVTYTGTLAADIRMFGTVGGTGLAPGLSSQVEIGTGAAGGSSFSCTGFTGGTTLHTGTLATFGTNHTGYANGLGGFTNASNPTTRSYRVTLTVSNDNSYQGRNATVDFTWEAQGLNGPS